MPSSAHLAHAGHALALHQSPSAAERAVARFGLAGAGGEADLALCITAVVPSGGGVVAPNCLQARKEKGNM